MRIVLALGGTALLDHGERVDAATQRRHVRAAARVIAPLAAHHELVLCHGNGPQLGTLALESENDDTLTRPYPLDAIGAQTQGMIGYWLVQELRRAGVTRPLAALVTQAVVDRDDPGFRAPSAFVGPGYTRDQVQLWAGELGWRMAHDGHAWRRVVPSLSPRHVLELPTIAALLAAGTVVVCGGGGGVPVCGASVAGGGGEVPHAAAAFEGVDAVVDTDLTAAHLAVALDADRLVLLTDVAEVRADFGGPQEHPLHRITLAELDGLTFAADSMAPKIEASRRFAVATGRTAVIGALCEADRVAAGIAGTSVTAR